MSIMNPRLSYFDAPRLGYLVEKKGAHPQFRAANPSGLAEISPVIIFEKLRSTRDAVSLMAGSLDGG